jgi:hypothetical protein
MRTAQVGRFAKKAKGSESGLRMNEGEALADPPVIPGAAAQGISELPQVPG